MQPKESGWARTANGEFTDLGADTSFLGVFRFGLIRFHLAVHPDWEFSHLIVCSCQKLTFFF